MVDASVDKGTKSVNPMGFGSRSEILSAVPAMPLHPLLAHPVAAFAAATAVGFGMATQMTGAMFGTWQGFMAASHLPSKSHNKQSAAPVVIVAEPKRSPEYDVAPVAISKADGEPLAKPAEDAPAFKTKSIGREKVAVAGRKKTTSTAHDLKSADDLKKISGVGPKMMQMLQGMGVTGFADIAAWTQEDAKRIDAELGLNGRILRDDWIGQAKNLLGQA